MRRLLLLALAAFASTGCGSGEVTDLTGTGSTFVEPLLREWADAYEKVGGLPVTYQGTGSGQGIRNMASCAVDFGCTDAFMTADQLEDAVGEVLHLPLTMGGVVPAYNLDLPEGTQLNFTGEILADIYLGEITRWNDERLRAINPGVELPDSRILVVYRADNSGTTSIFTDYLCKVSPAFEEKVGQGVSVRFPVGGGEPKTSGVAGFISKNPGSIGYVELLFALDRNLPYGKVKNRAGEFVAADLDSVSRAAEASLKDIPDDLRYSITDPDGKGVYPIAGTVWAVVYAKQEPGKGKALKDFFRWTVRDGQTLAARKHYAPLPPGLVKKIEAKIDRITE